LFFYYHLVGKCKKILKFFVIQAKLIQRKLRSINICTSGGVLLSAQFPTNKANYENKALDGGSPPRCGAGDFIFDHGVDGAAGLGQ
jgi:hypothetical protein